MFQTVSQSMWWRPYLEILFCYVDIYIPLSSYADKVDMVRRFNRI